MNETAFVDRRKNDWGRLSFLCDKAERSIRALTADEFAEFVTLYKRASTDLAVVRTKSKNLQLADFLNDLVSRAYGSLYTEPRGSIFSSIGFGLKLAAQTVRRRRWFVLTSGLLFFGSAFWSFLLMTFVPATRDNFIPPGMEKQFEEWKRPFDQRSASESAGMTGFYLSNNPRAAIFAGAISAATFGLGTATMLYENGVLLGALAKDLEPSGQTRRFLIWISPHGVPELSGVIISGAAGFLIAWCLIHPGRRRRGAALRDAGKDIIVLLTTGTMMMFVAAPIEGFFSFNPIVPDYIKLSVTVISLAGWITFWSGYGKEPAELTPVTRL